MILCQKKITLFQASYFGSGMRWGLGHLARNTQNTPETDLRGLKIHSSWGSCTTLQDSTGYLPRQHPLFQSKIWGLKNTKICKVLTLQEDEKGRNEGGPLWPFRRRETQWDPRKPVFVWTLDVHHNVKFSFYLEDLSWNVPLTLMFKKVPDKKLVK